jgi:steroid delta-isomerase-like uncharacterized protein
LPRRKRLCTWRAAVPGPRRGGACVPVSADQRKALVRRYYQDVLTARRLDVLEALVAPQFVGHDPIGARMDRSGYIDSVRMWHDGFGRIVVRVDDQVAEGNRVTTRWSATGTHTGRFAGIPATGREVTMSGIDIHRVQSGRLVELWEQLDLASLLAQML